MAEIENLSAIADKLPIRGTFSQLIFQIPLRDMLFLPQNTTNITFCSLIIWQCMVKLLVQLFQRANLLSEEFPL